jgi:hypothetical protein
MDPLSLIVAKLNLALFGILGYLEMPEVLFAAAAVAVILSLVLINRHH